MNAKNKSGLGAGPSIKVQQDKAAADVTQFIASFMGRSVHGAKDYRAPLDPGPGRTVDLCTGCDVDCCSHHVLPLTVVDAYRIHKELKLPFQDFAALVPYPADAPTWPVRLARGRALLALRRRRSSCIFLHRIGPHRRCAIHALRPMACRLFPFLPDADAQKKAPEGMMAQMPPNECPWRWPRDSQAVSELDAMLDENVRSQEIDQQVLRIWHRQMNMPHDRDHFYEFLDQEMARREAGGSGNGPWRTALW